MSIQPKKSLGQNFLKDESILEKIIEASNPQEADLVVEIGPGEGALTEKLVRVAKKIVAIELDTQLMPALQEKFSSNQNIEIIHGDILKINLPELFRRYLSTLPAGRQARYKLIANIPYYITSPIIRLFLEQETQPNEMFLMVQKEVAERIVASKGQMSILSVSVSYYAQAEIIFAVDKRAFFPIPRVDSAVIKIVPQRKFNKIEDKKFFRIVRAGFSAKRKTLLNNLAVSLQIQKKLLEKILGEILLNKNSRAQELSIDDWKNLVAKLDTTRHQDVDGDE